MRSIASKTALSLSIVLAFQSTAMGQERVNLLPEPQVLEIQEGQGFTMGSRLHLRHGPVDALEGEHLRVFQEAVASGWGVTILTPGPLTDQNPDLLFRRGEDLAPGAYTVEVGDSIVVDFADTKGLTHATATLLQLLPHDGATLPAMRIEDFPANPYRSFMVDLGRNPHGLLALKRTVDLAWYYKLDSVHLHLTDDQRFAFPSTAFPKLQQGDDHLGLADFRELEAYAVARGITLIPELEAPGHGSLLREHYPEVFGTTPTELATLPSARGGLKTLLREMMEVFRSTPHLHIGGDEAYGVPHEAQRDLINDLQAFLSGHDRTAVVWEGPGLGSGENKVDPAVIHLNWRTIEFPADAMLEAGYPVVNAAWDPLYIVDHYPRNNFTMAAPGHIYRTLELTRFKHFNPGIPTFAKPTVVEPNERLLGYCMPWWEGREQHYLPLITPRLIAMAAVAWREPEVRDVAWFERTARATEARRRLAFPTVQVRTSTRAVPSADVFHHELEVTLHPPDGHPGTLRFTLDGSAPTEASPAYEAPLRFRSSVDLRAEMFLRGEPQGMETRRRFTMVEPIPNLALGKPVSTSVAEGPIFCAARLTDGGIGNLDYFLGYPALPEPIHIIVDLEAVESVQQIRVHTYTTGTSYESFEVDLSTDGEIWTTVAVRRDAPENPAIPARFEFSPQQARYLRLRTFGHKGQVFDSFSRITEIEVH